MLLFAQEQTKHPCTASSYSFSRVLPLVDYFASSCGCTRAAAWLSRALAKSRAAEKEGRGGKYKEISQEAQIFYYFLFVQSMSTLGTRCAICLELRCQLDRMCFFSPDLTQKETEHKKTPSLCELVRCWWGCLGTTAAQSRPPASPAAHVLVLLLTWLWGLKPAHSVLQHPGSSSPGVPFQAPSQAPQGAPAPTYFPVISHPSQLHLKLLRSFFLGRALVKRLA